MIDYTDDYQYLLKNGQKIVVMGGEFDPRDGAIGLLDWAKNILGLP